MKNKWIEVLEGYHNIFRVLGSVIPWGGFFLILIVATVTQGFPDGFLIGLIVGAIFAFASWFGFRHSYRSAVETREKFSAYTQGQKDVFKPSKQTAYATLAVVLIGLLTLLMLGSCYFYSCENDLVRSRIIAILIALSVIIQQVFGKERLKGKPALVASGVLAILTIFLLGKVFGIW